jgi:hypothetical protein
MERGWARQRARPFLFAGAARTASCPNSQRSAETHGLVKTNTPPARHALRIETIRDPGATAATASKDPAGFHSQPPLNCANSFPE